MIRSAAVGRVEFVIRHPAFVVLHAATHASELLVSAEFIAALRSANDVRDFISRGEYSEESRVITETMQPRHGRFHGLKQRAVLDQTTQFPVMAIDLAAPRSLPRASDVMAIMPVVSFGGALKIAIE